MAKIIPILVVVDAERILRDHTPNGCYPVPLRNAGRGYAFLMTEWADTDQYQGKTTDSAVGEQDQEQGGYSLNVRADVGDIIRWRAVSLSSAFQFRAYLYGLEAAGSWINVTAPEPKTQKVTYAAVIPDKGAPGSLTTVQANDYWWESTVQKTIRQGYNLQYAIVDHNGSNRGIFTHDPYIT